MGSCCPWSPTPAGEDIDGPRRQQHQGDANVDPLGLHSQEVEAVVDAADDDASQDRMDGSCPDPRRGWCRR
jgi:hypothetical protein